MLSNSAYVQYPLSRKYFSVALVLFLLSYVLLPTAKLANSFYYAFIAVPGLFFLIKERGAGFFSRPLSWAWFAFMLWMLVPASQVYHPQFYKHLLYVFLFVFVVSSLTLKDFFEGPLFARVMFWVACLYIFSSGIYAYASGDYHLGQRVALLYLRLDNVIYASAWMVCSFALASPVWFKQRRFIELSAALVLMLLAIVVVLQTRTALFGVLVLTALWFAYFIRRAPLQGLFSLLAVVAVSVLIVSLVKDQEWFLLMLERGDSYRIELFHIMLGEWQSCGWLLGCGLDFVTSQTLPGGYKIPHPHSIFMALGVYTGIVALVLFLLLMACTLWQAWRQKNPWGLYLICALGMLNFDGSKLIGNPDELWLLVLLPAAMVLGRAPSYRRAYT
jgi:hypothetical protein